MARFLACVTVGDPGCLGIVGCGDSGGSVSARDKTQETTTTEAMPSTAADYVGLTKKAAIAKAEAEARPWRIGSEDGEVVPRDPGLQP